MIEVVIIVTPILILGVIFFLCDDWREYKIDWKKFVLMLVPFLIFIGYPIYMFAGVWYTGDKLWNPYPFCGMPTYAFGTGYTWWNLINVFVSTIKNVLYYNPLGVALFGISAFWFLKRKGVLTYLLMLFMEILMLYFAHWNYGLEIGLLK